MMLGSNKLLERHGPRREIQLLLWLHQYRGPGWPSMSSFSNSLSASERPPGFLGCPQTSQEADVEAEWQFTGVQCNYSVGRPCRNHEGSQLQPPACLFSKGSQVPHLNASGLTPDVSHLPQGLVLSCGVGQHLCPVVVGHDLSPTFPCLCRCPSVALFLSPSHPLLPLLPC